MSLPPTIPSRLPPDRRRRSAGLRLGESCDPRDRLTAPISGRPRPKRRISRGDQFLSPSLQRRRAASDVARPRPCALPLAAAPSGHKSRRCRRVWERSLRSPPCASRARGIAIPSPEAGEGRRQHPDVAEVLAPGCANNWYIRELSRAARRNDAASRLLKAKAWELHTGGELTCAAR